MAEDADATGTEPGGDERDAYDESEVRTIALAVVGGLVFGGLATGVAYPTLPLLTDVLGISAAMLGVVLSANRFARLVMNTPAGNVIDRVGTRTPMIAGLFVQALAPFGYVVGLHTPPGSVAAPVVGAVSYPGAVFVVARLAWGVGSAFVFLGAFATVTHVTTSDNRGRWLGYMRAGQSLGFPSGLVVGGLLFNYAGAETAFLAAGVLALLAGVVAASVLPELHPTAERRASLRAVPAMIRREPRILPLGVGNMTIRFVFAGLLLATVASHARRQGMSIAGLGLDAGGLSGVVLAVGVFTSSATTLVSGRVSDRLDRRALVTVPAFLAMAAGLVVVAAVPTLPALVAGVALVGVGTGGAGPTLLALVGDITPGDEVGRMGSVYQVLGDVGLTCGPLLAVPMVETWLGFGTTYLVVAGLVLATLAVVVASLLWTGVEAGPDD
jgi:MFS family permease